MFKKKLKVNLMPKHAKYVLLGLYIRQAFPNKVKSIHSFLISVDLLASIMKFKCSVTVYVIYEL